MAGAKDNISPAAASRPGWQAALRPFDDSRGDGGFGPGDAK